MISIAAYRFKLIWRTISTTGNTASLKTLTVQGYEASLQLLKNVRSRDRPTEIDILEAQSWHITGLKTKVVVSRTLRNFFAKSAREPSVRSAVRSIGPLRLCLHICYQSS